MTLHWPQITYLCFFGFSLLAGAVLDGTPKSGTNRFSVTFVSLLIGLAIVYFGGFFNGTSP